MFISLCRNCMLTLRKDITKVQKIIETLIYFDHYFRKLNTFRTNSIQKCIISLFIPLQVLISVQSDIKSTRTRNSEYIVVSLAV